MLIGLLPQADYVALPGGRDEGLKVAGDGGYDPATVLSIRIRL